MQALHRMAVRIFTYPKTPYSTRHGIASIVKVVMLHHAQMANLTLGDRCGAQGLFEYNQLAGMHVSIVT